MTDRKKAASLPVLLLAAALVIFSVTPFGNRFWREMFRRSGFAVNSEAPLKIHVLDVGKADAVLIECEGHAALIDAGTYTSGETVTDYLLRNGVQTLEYAVVTHPDKDHIGGLGTVLSELEVGALVRSFGFDEEYDAVAPVLERKNIACRRISLGETLNVGSAALHCIGPVKEYEDTNDASLIFRLEYGGFSALFCGDVEKEGEKDLVKSGAELKADLLKVPHHGSKSSSSKRLLNAVKPRYAVISVGRDRNRLPHEETLLRLKDAGVEEIYRTDTDGTVVFCIGENGIEIVTEK